MSGMELLAKIVKNVHLKPLTILAKSSILDIQLGPKCASAGGYQTVAKTRREISA